MDSAFITYLQNHFVSTVTLKAVQVNIQTLFTNYGEIVDLLSGTVTTGSLQSIVISAKMQ